MTTRAATGWAEPLALAGLALAALLPAVAVLLCVRAVVRLATRAARR